MNIRTLLMAVLLLFLPAAQVATAQSTPSQPKTSQSNAVSVQPVHVLLASLIVGKDARGQETLTPTSAGATPRPGDLLAWKATAVNDLSSSVPDLALTIPIPATTVYLEGSAPRSFHPSSVSTVRISRPPPSNAGSVSLKTASARFRR